MGTGTCLGLGQSRERGQEGHFSEIVPTHIGSDLPDWPVSPKPPAPRLGEVSVALKWQTCRLGSQKPPQGLLYH